MEVPQADGFPIVGEKRIVDFARWSKRGETIEQWNNMDIKDQAKLYNRFQRLAHDGRMPPPLMEHLGDGIYEVKIDGHQRAGMFENCLTWYITHFFKTSHKKKRVNKEKQRAEQARSEHMGNGVSGG